MLNIKQYQYTVTVPIKVEIRSKTDGHVLHTLSETLTVKLTRARVRALRKLAKAFDVPYEDTVRGVLQGVVWRKDTFLAEYRKHHPGAGQNIQCDMTLKGDLTWIKEDQKQQVPTNPHDL